MAQTGTVMLAQIAITNGARNIITIRKITAASKLVQFGFANKTCSGFNFAFLS
jgi:hypothetical protein